MCCHGKVLRFAIGDSSLSKIIRSQLNRHAVARYDPDKMFPHLPSDMSYDSMAILELYNKLSPWKGLNDCSRKFDHFLVIGHKYNKY